MASLLAALAVLALVAEVVHHHRLTAMEAQDS